VAIAAALALRGNGALLNFPKLAHSLPRLADLSDKSIQAAATIAANNFAQRSPDDSASFEISSSQTSPKADTRDPRLQQRNTATGSASQRHPNGGKSSKRDTSSSAPYKSFTRPSGRNTSSSEELSSHRVSYNVIDSSGRESPAENLQHHRVVELGENLRENLAAGSAGLVTHPHPQPMYIDSEDMFTIGPVGLNNLCDAMCIPPPDPDHATETDGEEGSNSTWEPHLWSY